MARDSWAGNLQAARKKVRKKRRAASFCVNRSLSVSSNSSGRWSKVSTKSLKKNNEELARTLNKCKLVIARLTEEMQARNDELLTLQQEHRSLQQDHRIKCEMFENELMKRLKDVLFPVTETLNSAVDNMAGLSENLFSAMRMAKAPLRMSQAANASRSSSTGRNSSIGCNLRIRNVNHFLQPKPNTPPKTLPQSKVAPMVAGHAISRPRITLTRMDLAEHPQLLPSQPVQQAEQQEEQQVAEVVEEEEAEVVAPQEVDVEEGPVSEADGGLVDHQSPPQLRQRSRFNLTNIDEEESHLESLSPRASDLSSDSPTRSDQDTEEEVGEILEPVTRSDQELEEEVGEMLGPDTRSRQPDATTPSEPVSLPRSSEPATAALIQVPENANDSFFENMDYDPLEGPSWLYDSSDRRKRKKKSKVSRKLSLPAERGSRSSRRLANNFEASDIETTTSDISGYVVAEEEEADLIPLPMNIDTSLEAAELSQPKVLSPEKRPPLREVTVPQSGRVVTYNPRLDTGLVVEKLKEARIYIQNSSPNISGLGTPYRLSEVYISSPGHRHSLEEVVSVGLSALSASDLPALQKAKGCYVRVSKSPAHLEFASTTTTAGGAGPSGGRDPAENDEDPAAVRRVSHRMEQQQQGSGALPTGRHHHKAGKSRSEVPRKRNTTELPEAEHRITEEREGEAEEEEVGEERTANIKVVKRKGQSEPVGVAGAKKKRIAGDKLGETNAPSSPAESDKENKEMEGGEQNGIEPEQQQHEQEGLRRGRRAAAQISFKEPSLKGKMRQGDAGTTSVYSDLAPVKGRKSKK